MTGTTVTLHPHWRKQNQCVMNQQLPTSISGKLVTENLVGEGWGEGLRSIVGRNPSPGSLTRSDLSRWERWKSRTEATMTVARSRRRATLWWARRHAGGPRGAPLHDSR